MILRYCENRTVLIVCVWNVFETQYKAQQDSSVLIIWYSYQDVELIRAATLFLEGEFFTVLNPLRLGAIALGAR